MGAPEAAGVRERLLDAAERLFGEQGIAETSVRALTSAAGANVAAVSYYFGSREGLVREVIARRMEPLNQERLRRLAEARAAGEPPAPEAVLRALAEPSLRLCFEHPHFARLASRLRLGTDEALWQGYRTMQAPVLGAFRAAFAAARPELEEGETWNRLHYVVGAIHHLWSHCPLPPEQTQERLLASFLAFYGAALRAPAP